MSHELYIYDLVKGICPRTYLNVAPHNPVKPFLLVTHVSSTHEHVLGGSRQVANAEYQFDAVSTDLEDTITMIDQIRSILDCYHDDRIIHSAVVVEQDLSLPPSDDSPNFLYRKAARYLIRIKYE